MSDSPVIAFLNKMTDIIILNLLFLLCCIPIVTIGAACTALYHVSILSIRLGDGYVVKRFFTSFKNDFKQATILWLLLLLISAFLGWDIFFWSQLGNDMGKVMICLSTAVWLIVAVISLYLFPVLSKLEGSLWMTIRNAAAFAVGYLPYTLILVVLTGSFIWANVTSPVMNVISIFVGFALLAYIKSFFIYKVMMNHIDERYDDLLEPMDDE